MFYVDHKFWNNSGCKISIVLMYSYSRITCVQEALSFPWYFIVKVNKQNVAYIIYLFKLISAVQSKLISCLLCFTTGLSVFSAHQQPAILVY